MTMDTSFVCLFCRGNRYQAEKGPQRKKGRGVEGLLSSIFVVFVTSLKTCYKALVVWYRFLWLFLSLTIDKFQGILCFFFFFCIQKVECTGQVTGHTHGAKTYFIALSFPKYSLLPIFFFQSSGFSRPYIFMGFSIFLGVFSVIRNDVERVEAHQQHSVSCCDPAQCVTVLAEVPEAFKQSLCLYLG